MRWSIMCDTIIVTGEATADGVTDLRFGGN
jgi:hypothetical protein